MRKYLISGIPISDSGVGRLMRKIVPEAESRGYTLITFSPLRSIKKAIFEKQYSKIISEVFNRFFGDFIFKTRIVFLRQSVIVFIHPQTSGFENLISLTKHNKVYLYVMDNSFFCIRSYNTHPYFNTECFHCLGTPGNVLDACAPYPIPLPKKKNTAYLESLMDISDKITFLAQNEKQKMLLERHFGQNISCLVVGLDTGEIPYENQANTLGSGLANEILKFDIVYHGSPHLAKGIAYVVELARILKEFSFFIPEDKEVCELIVGKSIEYQNMTFMACRWETGLKSAVSQTRLVINPSLWSASIEGALLKSIFYAPKVAIVKTEYGFEGEIWKQFNLVRLPLDASIAADILRATLSNSSEADTLMQNRANLTSFLNRKSIFDVVDDHISESILS